MEIDQDFNEFTLPDEYQGKLAEYKRAQGQMVLDGFIGNLPIVGPFWSSYRSTIFEMKVAERFCMFDRELKALGVSALTLDYFSTGAGFDLITNLFQRVIGTHSEEKIKRFARIVQGLLIGEEITFEQADMFVDITGQLDDKAIKMLATLIQREMLKDISPSNMTGDEKSFPVIMKNVGIDREEQLYCLCKLQAVGIILPISSFVSGGMAYDITELGLKYTDFLKLQEC